MFIHLHNHSVYSLLDGACRIKGLIDKAIKFRMPAIAITDHGNLHGIIEFYEYARKAGIHPIIGQEFYVARYSRLDKKDSLNKNRKNFHLTVLAKDNLGYRNLIKLSSIAFLEGFYYKPRIDREILEKYSEGLIVLSGCLQGEIPWNLKRENYDEAKEAARWFLEIFGTENFFIELQNHNINDEIVILPKLIQLAKEMGIKTVATNDVHYIEKEDADFHDKMLCIQTDSKLSDENRMRMLPYEFYLKSPQEMQNLFNDIPEAIDNTLKIAEMTNVNIELGKNHLPEFEVPDGFENVEQYLAQRAEEGLKQRYKKITKELRHRLEYELSVIEKMNYSSYFSIVAEITDNARKLGVWIGPGRGSSGGSLVAYSLGITNVDPIKYNLLFERFLNPERVSMPDFDIDFDDENRDKVIEYTRNKYGAESVCQIITFNTLKSKQAVKDVGRIFGLKFRETNALTAMILGNTIKSSFAESNDLKALYNEDPRIKEVMDYAMKMEGFPRNAGVHAAGVVITPGKLVDYVPLYRTSKGEITTQFSMDSLEKIGLLKMDFLGLTTLSILRESVRLVKISEENLLDLDIIPMDDEEVYMMFGEGDTIGIFQFESDGMRKCLRGLKPDNIEDLIAMSALYRPGPMKFIDSFINRKHGKEKVEYPHKYVEDILRTTYGIAVYQEQVMLLAQKLAGYTLGEADLLRRAIGKKDMAAMEVHRETFLKRASKKDIPKRIAKDVYAIIAKFAEYGFNKPHSTAYAILAYKTAYVKKHFPKQFIAANLTSSAKKPIEVQKFINECKRLSIRIFSPDVNFSEEKFTVQDDGIRFGLCSIKNLGFNAMEAIVSERKRDGEYTDIFNFFERIEDGVLNKKSLEMLVASGAMDSLGVSRASLILSLESLVNWKHELTRAKIANLQSLFGDNNDSVFTPTVVEMNEWKQSELLKYEKLALGVYLSGHPLDDYSIDVEAFTSGKIGEVKNIHHEREVRLAGLLSSFTVKPTKNDQQMGIGVLQDQTGELKVLFFSSIFDKCQLFIGEEAILWIEGSLKFDPDNTPVLMAESVKPMENIREELAKQLHIKLNEDNSDELLRYILRIIENNPGKAEVHLHIDSNRRTYKAVSVEHLCNPVNRLIREIENKLGRGNVWLA